MLTNKTILITGETGSFGKAFVPTAEYNPFERIKTHVHRTMSLIEAYCLDKGMELFTALSINWRKNE